MKFKKLFAVIAFVAVLAVFAVPAFAGSLGEDWGEVPWVPEAPVLDGQMDDLYENALFFVVDHPRPGDPDTGLMAEYRVMWHGDHIYVLATVYDYDIVLPDAGRSRPNPWLYDSAEFLIDYAGDNYYIDDNGTLPQVLQFRSDVSGYQSSYGYNPTITEQKKMAWQAYGKDESAVGSKANNEKGLYAGDFFESAVFFTSDMYSVEFKLPLSNKGFNSWGNVTLEPGDSFAIMGQVNEDYSGRTGDVTLYRLEGLDETIWQAQFWPNVTLGYPYEVEEEPDEPVADDPVDDPADDPVDEPADDPVVDEPADDPADDPADVPDLPGLDPVEPTVPVEPDEPTDPVDPVEPSTYAMTFDPANGSDIFQRGYVEGSKHALPEAPAKDGYEFVGWKASDGTVYNAKDSYYATGEETFTAQWKELVADPVEPDEPTDPVEPDEPTDPVEPDEPTDPVEPDEPTDPVEPDEPTDPVEPDESTEPVEPDEPTDPVEPDEPTDPEVPTEPDEPFEPADSDVTEEPSKLGTPAIIGIVVAVVTVIAVVVILVSKKKK